MISIFIGIILLMMNISAFFYLHKASKYILSTQSLSICIIYVILLVLTEIFTFFAPAKMVNTGITEMEEKRKKKNESK